MNLIFGKRLLGALCALIAQPPRLTLGLHKTPWVLSHMCNNPKHFQHHFSWISFCIAQITIQFVEPTIPLIWKGFAINISEYLPHNLHFPFSNRKVTWAFLSYHISKNSWIQCWSHLGMLIIKVQWFLMDLTGFFTNVNRYEFNVYYANTKCLMSIVAIFTGHLKQSLKSNIYQNDPKTRIITIQWLSIMLIIRKVFSST